MVIKYIRKGKLKTKDYFILDTNKYEYKVQNKLRKTTIELISDHSDTNSLDIEVTMGLEEYKFYFGKDVWSAQTKMKSYQFSNDGQIFEVRRKNKKDTIMYNGEIIAYFEHKHWYESNYQVITKVDSFNKQVWQIIIMLHYIKRMEATITATFAAV